MFKNVASQKLRVFAFDSTTNLPKSGDAANITAYVSKDWGAVTVLGDTSATEEDATNAKGYYLFDLTQGETNGDYLGFSAKSSTANIVVIGAPAVVYTVPPNFTSQSIDSNGRVDVIKVAGTSQTAGDIYARLGAPSGASMSADAAATFARLGAPAGASVSADVAAVKTVDDAIKAKTDNLPAAPAAVSDIPTAVQNADALLGRNIAGGSSAGRTVKQALRFLRNKWTIATGTLTVYQEDDSTSDWTAVVSTDASAVPIVGNDPA